MNRPETNARGANGRRVTWRDQHARAEVILAPGRDGDALRQLATRPRTVADPDWLAPDVDSLPVHEGAAGSDRQFRRSSEVSKVPPIRLGEGEGGKPRPNTSSTRAGKSVSNA